MGKKDYQLGKLVIFENFCVLPFADVNIKMSSIYSYFLGSGDLGFTEFPPHPDLGGRPDDIQSTRVLHTPTVQLF